MAKRPFARWTIRQLMALVAGVAIAWVLIDSVRVGRYLVALVVPTVLLAAAVAGFIHFLANPTLGIGCPYCGRMALERRAVASFGNRFYRCSHCGVRCMRVILGGWKDASNSRYDPFYEKKKLDGDPWTAPPGLEDEDLMASKTHLRLIQSKRNRRPENPNGPGLE